MANQPQDAEVKGDVFKHQDTTRSISMRFKNDIGTWIIPDSTHTFTAKVANDTGLIGSYPVEIQGNQIILPTSELTELPPNDGTGHYSLEIWESYTDADDKEQTAIYPTPGYRVNFTVEENIADKTGQLIKQIGFQDVVNAAAIQAGQNLVVGNTTTLDPGQKASVSQVYKNGKNVLNFFIPQGPRGFQGPAGKAFHIQQTFPTIDAMNAGKGAGFEDGDFALIASNVQDPDNAKMYVWTGDKFNYMGDLSGAQGIQGPVGPSPTMNVVSVTASAPGSQPSVTYTKRDGGYDVSYVLPRGERGDNWTEDDKQTILTETKQYVEDTILNGGLFETRIVSGTVTDVKNNGIAGIPIKAPSVEGYAFLFWLNSSSVGQVTDSYIESPTNSSTNIWSNDCFKGEKFQSVAVYVKNAFSELAGNS